MSYLLLDIAGFSLTEEDKEILTHPAVFGVILFTRNYHHPEQLGALTQSIRQLRSNLRIVVDQEGGRVQRFKEAFTALPSMRTWGMEYQKKGDQAILNFKILLHTMLDELKSVGIDATLVPVLDLDFGMSEIIGERSFNRDPEIVSHLANIVIDLLHEYGMPATGKHFPGHGAVVPDSHEQLPIDSRPFSEIWQNDLLPYQKLAHRLDAVMPAHIVYENVDNKPAGFSQRWLQDILRHQLKFEGLIISDDISMKAADSFGDYLDRACLAWEAGCDVVTICNHRSGTLMVLDGMSRKTTKSILKKNRRFHPTNKFV